MYLEVPFEHDRVLFIKDVSALHSFPNCNYLAISYHLIFDTGGPVV